MSFSKSPDNKMPQIFDFLLIKYLLKDVHTVPAYFKGFFFKKRDTKICIREEILLSTKKFLY